jgi:hypothetical protein
VGDPFFDENEFAVAVDVVAVAVVVAAAAAAAAVVVVVGDDNGRDAVAAVDDYLDTVGFLLVAEVEAVGVGSINFVGRIVVVVVAGSGPWVNMMSTEKMLK